MLEVTAHNHVKRLLKKKGFQWNQNLTLTRLVSRSLSQRDQTLINIENSCQDLWWLGLLTPLCLATSNAILLLSSRQRQQLIEIEVPKLKMEGLDFIFWEGSTPPRFGEVWLVDYEEFLVALSNNWVKNRHLIVLEAEYLSDRLRHQLSIEITSADWDTLISKFSFLETSIIQIYERLTRRLFRLSTSKDETMRIDISQLQLLKEVFSSVSLLPSPWEDVSNAINEEWLSWAQLNTEMLTWSLHFQPLEPLKTLTNFWSGSSFLMISDIRQSKFLTSELQKANCPLPSHLNLGGFLYQEPIHLFVPKRQPLPNSPYFYHHILDLLQFGY